MKKPKTKVKAGKKPVRKAPVPTQLITLTFTVEAVQQLLHQLGQRPFDQIAALYIEIQDKANEQLVLGASAQNGAGHFTVAQPTALPAPQ